METKKMLVPLELQLFAEGDGGTGDTSHTPPPTQQNTGTIDYGKIEDIISKRSSNTADSVLKGYLKEQGLSGEELNQAIEGFKTKKQQEALAAQQEKDNLAQANKELMDKLNNLTIDNALASVEGVSKEKVPFLARLINREGLLDENGTIVKEKFDASVEEVVKAFPEIKVQPQNGGFQQIGANIESTHTTTDKSVAAFQNGRIVLPKK